MILLDTERESAVYEQENNGKGLNSFHSMI